MNPKKPKAKTKNRRRVQRRLNSVVRCYPGALYCLFQGEALEPFLVFRKRKTAEAVLAAETLGHPHRDYHMAQYIIAPNAGHQRTAESGTLNGLVRKGE